MKRKNPNESIKVLLLLSLLIVMCSFSSTFAWRGGGGGHGGGGSFHGAYWGGHSGWGWYGYPTIVAGGYYPYYYDGDYYSGYPVASSVVVVPSQPVSAESQQSNGNTLVVNIPNSNGKFTSIKLTKCANGYIGPEGEFYQNHATVAQLQALYGN